MTEPSVGSPVLDVNDGMKRVMNKKKLFVNLLSRLDLQKMVGDITEAVNSGNHKKVAESAHALKGAAGNLGLIRLKDLMLEIETRGKAERDASGLLGELEDIAAATRRAIAEIIAEDAAGE
ncbi:MAG: Hpt domain-containing protein [Clostridiales bacterium]|jgi:HPt (histidine-containing phosphotransfer) domain-containing protein|nr:Hpt domain-containing protein [Clostridiales bacterium]